MAEKPGEHTKVRISMQGWEVEAQGTQEFVQAELPALMEKMAELQRAAGVSQVSAGVPTRDQGAVVSVGSARINHVSTNTIASQTGADSGSGLVMAAMAHITLVQGKDAATRQEILEEMRSAKTFYKDSYSGNLTAYLDRLVKGKRLNLVAKETYALPNLERQQFEQLIAAAS